MVGGVERHWVLGLSGKKEIYRYIFVRCEPQSYIPNSLHACQFLEKALCFGLRRRLLLDTTLAQSLPERTHGVARLQHWRCSGCFRSQSTGTEGSKSWKLPTLLNNFHPSRPIIEASRIRLQDLFAAERASVSP